MADEPVKIEVEQPVTEIEVEAREVEAEAQAGAVETAAEAAVEIAEIEANRDVALAEIAAEARVDEAEAFAEAMSESEEKEEWRQNIEALQTAQLQMAEQMGALTEAVSSIQAQLMPPEPQPPTNSPDASADGLQAQEPEAAAEPPAEPQRKRRKLRWI